MMQSMWHRDHLGIIRSWCGRCHHLHKYGCSQRWLQERCKSGTSGSEHASQQQAKLQRKQYRALGRVAVLSGVALSGFLVYQEVKSFHGRFQTITNVFEIERNHSTYIYSFNEDAIDDEWEDLRQMPTRKLRKLKKMIAPWVSWVHLRSRSHDPHTLLKLAQSANHNIRLMGVKALAAKHNWHDSDYHSIAQSLDMRTLIGLARTPGVDRRFFLPPPKLPESKDPIEDEFRKLLAQLPSDGVDRCTQYFTSTALQGGKVSSEERGWFWLFDEYDRLTLQTKPLFDSPVAIHFFESLYRHSQIASHCAKIVENGGLQLLQQIYQLRRTSLKIQRNIAKVLSNLSIHESLHDEIVRAGWVSILIQWIASKDLAISLHAAKTLANLDLDFGIRPYVDGVYLYYPQHRYSEPVYADIVFVHGLLGGPFRTWRQQDISKELKSAQGSSKVSAAESSKSKVAVDLENYTFCWPKDWLAKDVPNIRILTVEYETHLTEWSPRCPFESEKRSLAVRSAEILSKLRQAGVGDRPIIWVGHSMGGLIIKQLLVTAGRDSSLQRLVDNSQGIVFYGVPHHGSALAAVSNQAKYLLYPSVEVMELKQGSKMLLHLHKNFQQLMFDLGIPLLSFGEGEKTTTQFNMKMVIVPEESSDPGFGEHHVMKSLNHLNICKPEKRESQLYQLTLEFIKSCIPLNRVQHVLRSTFFSDSSGPQEKPLS